MVVEPQRFLEAFVAAGAHRIFVHVEGAPLLTRTLARIRELGAEPAVAINPATPLVLLEEVLEHVDSILVMSVEPGFGGQAFQPRSIGKVERLRAMLDHARCSRVGIAVDGGVNAENIGALRRAGATSAIVGSALFNGPDGIAGNVRALRAAAAHVDPLTPTSKPHANPE
jgi:ribulose-phosphate 3-epimerase